MLQLPPLFPSQHAHTPCCSAGAPVTPFEHNWVILFRAGGYPFPDARVTAGTGCNAVGPRGGLPTQTSGL